MKSRLNRSRRKAVARERDVATRAARRTGKSMLERGELLHTEYYDVRPNRMVPSAGER